MNEHRPDLAEMEAMLEGMRQQLTADINELTVRINPRHHVRNFRRSINQLANDAASGDPKAIGIVGGVAAAVVGAIWLAVSGRK